MTETTRHKAPLVVLMGFGLIASLLAITVVLSSHGETLVSGYFRVDATSRLFLFVLNPIFFGISVYVWSRVTATPALQSSAWRFAALSIAFLACADLLLISNHLLMQWLALEATTLLAAPLIVRAGSRASVQASFRYLLFSSVGLGLALVGFLCLERGFEVDGLESTLLLDHLAELATRSPNVWHSLGLALVVLGLGTKLGLAPMYSWLPEVYDESPPAVTAMLGAIQFNCALVVLLRVLQTFRGSIVIGSFLANELVAMGILSMVVSTFNIIATRNFKRLLAYASINHAGVIAIGLGIGRAASYGLLLYVISNAVIKAILFLTAGKIEAHYRMKDTQKISGLLKDLPYSGALLMVGTFALLGFPPFASFFGELLILSALVGSGNMLVFAAFCVLITMTFVATGRTIFPMIWGEPKEAHDWPRQTFLAAAPKIALLAALVVLGVYVPPFANTLLQQVAASLVER